MKTSDYIIYDNGGASYDLYTILNKKTGDCYSCSENPFHPLGVAQYCGNIAESFWFTTYGNNWKDGCDDKLLAKRIKHAVSQYQTSDKIVPFASLPADVQKYIKQLA